MSKPEMNEKRQEALYSFLLSQGDDWTPLRQIAYMMPHTYPYLTLANFHNGPTRRIITQDIADINASDKYEKIIISGSYGVKLATKEELNEFLRAEYTEIFKKLMHVRRLERKGNLDQQTDIGGEIIDAFMGGS